MNEQIYGSGTGSGRQARVKARLFLTAAQSCNGFPSQWFVRGVLKGEPVLTHNWNFYYMLFSGGMNTINLRAETSFTPILQARHDTPACPRSHHISKMWTQHTSNELGY